MNRDELMAAMLAERYGPLATLVPEHPVEVVNRRRVLVESLPEDFHIPPIQPAPIDADVLRMRGLRWSARQIASLLGVEVREVDAVLARQSANTAADEVDA